LSTCRDRHRRQGCVATPFPPGVGARDRRGLGHEWEARVGGVVTSARFQAASAGPRRARIRIWLVLLLVAGSAIRLGLLAVYSPVAYPDTESYMAVARSIVAGDFSQYEARRTPGYPLVLALAGLSPGRVWWLQSLMGLAISALLFYLVLSLTGRPGLAALGG